MCNSNTSFQFGCLYSSVEEIVKSWTQWIADDAEMENGKASMHGELCKLFLFLSAFLLVVSFHPSS